MSDLQEVLSSSVEEHGVPGALVGVLENGHLEVRAAGVANLNTGAPMTPETLFLTGSITKVWVASMVMTLVEQGLIDLDAPVRQYLPDLVLGDPRAAGQITVRHLLCHASGLDAADLATDVGDGPLAIQRYLALLRDVGQLHPVGAYASYNNPGFVLAGRIIEVVTGQTFEEAVRARLFRPMDLERSFLTAAEAILHNTAIGHFPTATGHTPTDTFLLPAGMAPAGTSLLTCAADSLAFASHHFASGTLLTPEARTAMAAHQIDFPVPELGSFGLGWMRQKHGERLVLSHTGGSHGGLAQLLVVPDADQAFIVFANSSASEGLLAALRTYLLTERFGVPSVKPDFSDGPVASVQRYAGSYQRHGLEVLLEPIGHERLTMRMRWTEAVLQQYATGRPVEMELVALGSRALSLAAQPDVPIAYAVGEGDQPEYLYSGGRLLRRTGQA